MLAHRLLLLIAILASLVVLGCWDNQRQMQRVLDEGYDTLAQITGAQFQRSLPLAVDGWRPRFVEQDLSVNLTWQGKDGKAHEHRKVPVTETLARTLVSGDQVRLATLPVKVLDDDLAVPVIRPDAGARTSSLQSWLTISGYVALAAWAGFAGLTVWMRRRGIAGKTMVEVPLRRMLFGLVALFGGALLAFQAWSDSRAYEAMKGRGVETTAEIIDAAARQTKQDSPMSYTVRLAWKDGQGTVHHYGPTAISEGFWNKITRNGELTVRQTAIRYLPEDPQARPMIVDDAPEQGWQSRFGSIGGVVLMIVGAGCLFSAARHMRRAQG